MTITTLYKNYINILHSALWSIDTEKLDEAAQLIAYTTYGGGRIFVCGNGGSAALADHFTCDCMKGVRTDSILTPKVVSLSSNGPLITAIANDIGYDEIFSYQLESLMTDGDILITISSSGNSPNIRKALTHAKVNGYKTISLCGFDGGASLCADIPIHVKATNYGIVEDAHQAIIHMLSQYLRSENLKAGVEIDKLIF
jgi:D-sedoheptulose 7-phosphate isomerase